MHSFRNENNIFITAFGFQSDYIREIANAFALTGYDVILVGSNHHDKDWYVENVKFINLRGNDSPNRNFVDKITNLINYYFNLIKIIHKQRIRTIYDPSIGRPLLIILNYLLYKLIGRKIVLTVHNVLPHGKHSFYNFLLFKIIYRVLTDHLIVHTKFLENELLNKFSIRQDKITVASHGTYKINTNNTLDKEKARLSLNLSINDFVILIFGQQYSYKGTHILLEKYLSSIKQNYKLLICGSGNENYIAKLINIINNLSFKKDIIYNFRHISQEEMELFFKSSDVVCLPYSEGSQSGVLFMSYAFGRPVLASDVGNFKYDIKSGFSGEIFEVGNSDDFENKLLKIKNNLIQYDESEIKEFAAKNYSWENFAGIIINKVYKIQGIKLQYVIITPAKNEEKFIEKTIISVINQTILPLMWVIVDDGSSDSTAEIVKSYAEKYNFIRLVQREKENSRNFGSKVYAIRRGFDELNNLEFNFYCNLDADVSFEQNYFEFFLNKFSQNPKLGICGGKVYDLIINKFIAQSYDNHSVAGPVQFFRKECYESFGGYQAFKKGFIDGHAEISARMNGWETITFPEIKVKHYRPAGTAKGSKLKIKFIGGKFEYLFGYSYTYHLIRSINSFRHNPFILGGLSSMLGYLSCTIKKENRLVDDNFIKFVRKEQIERLKKKLSLI